MPSCRTHAILGLALYGVPVLLLSGLAGCSSNVHSGPPLAVRPADWDMVLAREEEAEERDADARWEVGPPPPGYIKITGMPVPDFWDENGNPRPRYDTRSNPLSWSTVGPRPISSEYWSGEANAGGRVESIAPHPTDSNICYIATPSGGIWKTTDGGVNWIPLTDGLSTLNHGYVLLDPTNPNTVYAGTGGYVDGTPGDGLFKSIDAGASWTRIATAAQVGTWCAGLAVDPSNNSIIHVAGQGGCYRTTNGGATWSKPLSGDVCAVEINPATPSIVYAARTTTGIYRSTNSGASYTKLAGGLPSTGFSRIVMDISASNPNVLYAAFINGSSMTGLYRTADGGTTWTKLTATPNFCSSQCWYDAYVAVDPVNENTVYCGGVDPRYAVAGVIKSTNGGASWTEISALGGQLHPDHHAMAFGANGVIWEGNDGGIWRSTTGGASWTNLNATLQAGQHYHIVQHPTQTNKLLGGTQDNGTPQKTGTSLAWPQSQVGDGGFSAYDPSTSTNRFYTTYVYLALTRWVNNTQKDITGPWGSDPVNWIAPILIDPNNANNLLAGTNRVWRTTNATATTPTWTAISTNTVSGGGTLNCLAVAVGASNTIYTGSSTGKVYVTTDASTWNNRSTGLPSGQISTIVISPVDPGTAYVAFYNSTGNRILKTTNFGSTWTNMTGSLPSGVEGRALAIDFAPPIPAMYVGAGSGVYASFNNGVDWVKNDATLPNVNIGYLHLDPIARTLTAGTYGRGVFRSSLPPPNCPADFDGSGFVDFDDFNEFVVAFEAGDDSADFDGSGFVDFDDFNKFVIAFESGC